MDDIFGQRPKTPFEEAWHAEQERKKYDIIRVKNPTNQDSYVKYDINRFQKIPANSTMDVPRYIAIRYVIHMKDTIIHAMSQKKHDDTMAERRVKGFPEYKTKWEENQETYMSDSYPKTNNEALMSQVMGELWVGLVYEFGRDVPPAGDPRAGEVDLTPVATKIMDSFDKRRVEPDENSASVLRQDFIPRPIVNTPPPPPPAPVLDFGNLKDSLVSEVTNE